MEHLHTDASYAAQDVAQSLFGIENGGGVVTVATAPPSSLVAMARTWRSGRGGTVGQWIDGITDGEAAGNSTLLHLPAIEENSTTRTHVGFVETTGSAVSVEVTPVDRDGEKHAPMIIELAPFEFRQLTQILRRFEVPLESASLEIRVLHGDGRIVAYASILDIASGDAAFVQAR